MGIHYHLETYYRETLYTSTEGCNTISELLQEAIDSKVDLSGLYLTDCEIHEVVFTKIPEKMNLFGVKFHNCRFEGYTKGVNIKVCQFHDCSFNKAYFFTTTIRGTEFHSCGIWSCVFMWCLFSGVRLVGGGISTCHFYPGVLRDIIKSADTAWARVTMLETELDNYIIPQPYNPKIIPDGDLIVYKKLGQSKVATLKIPASAKRVISTGGKCRAEYAEVIAIEGYDYDDLDGNFIVSGTYTDGYSLNTPNFVYVVGETVKPDSFNPNWQAECTNGIHFFLTKQEALNY